jgi:hypothetical protein
MSAVSSLRMYSRLAFGLHGFLRRRMTLEAARDIVRQRIATRDDRFLRIVERGIYGHPKSPYLPLLRMARCELGDVRQMVRDRGLDATLCALRAAGVYVTFEEFKGRVPIVRDGQVIEATASDFDNPYLSPYYYAESGGSTGAGTRVPMDLNNTWSIIPLYTIGYHAHDVLDAPLGLWIGVLPNGSGISNVLRSCVLGNPARVWFAPTTADQLRRSLKYRLATQYIVWSARLHGFAAPLPQPVPFDEAVRVARWAASMARAHGKCLVRTSVSMSLRIALASRDAGIDLTGVTLMGGGEPPTPAKVRGITQTGATWVPTYYFSEGGPVGMGCRHPLDGNDLHYFRDAQALIQYPQLVPNSDVTVNAFCFTTLLPTSPKLLLNVQSDDFGEIETRRCGCELEAIGFTQHIRHVRSFRKLTGEGATLIGTDMVRILEEVLPARFGGSALDYQLAEEEDADGFTRMSIVVSPRIPVHNEQAVVAVVLDELSRTSGMADVARGIWQSARTLRVKRAEPVWTARGKFPSLQPARRS